MPNAVAVQSGWLQQEQSRKLAKPDFGKEVKDAETDAYLIRGTSTNTRIRMPRPSLNVHKIAKQELENEGSLLMSTILR